MAKKKKAAKDGEEGFADAPPTYDELKAENDAYKAKYGELEAEETVPVEFPKWLYKYEVVDGKPVRTDSMLVQSQAEQDALGPGWVDHYDDGSEKPAGPEPK